MGVLLLGKGKITGAVVVVGLGDRGEFRQLGVGMIVGDVVEDADPDVVGLDWRTDIAVARKRLGRRTAVQGNLDPCALFLPDKEIRRRTT